MSYSHAAATYREREIRTASPGRLVVIVFDHVLASFNRARVAHANGMIEQRLEAVAKARDGITELLATLDEERGGAIATQLRTLYTFLLAQIADAGVRFDDAKIVRLSGIVTELRDAFAAIAAEPVAQSPAA